MYVGKVEMGRPGERIKIGTLAKNVIFSIDL